MVWLKAGPPKLFDRRVSVFVNKWDPSPSIYKCMATPGTNFLRLVPAVSLMLSVSASPCACALSESAGGATSCCTSSAWATSGAVPNSPACNDECCDPGQKPSSSGRHGSGLCCAACPDVCDRPTNLSWNPETSIPKSGLDLQVATRPPSIPLTLVLEESSPAVDRASPSGGCPTYISNHLLRI